MPNWCRHCRRRLNEYWRSHAFGGYRSNFGGGYTVELADVYFDLGDLRC